jgi:hypothetical protein
LKVTIKLINVVALYYLDCCKMFMKWCLTGPTFFTLFPFLHCLK